MQALICISDLRWGFMWQRPPTFVGASGAALLGDLCGSTGDQPRDHEAAAGDLCGQHPYQRNHNRGRDATASRLGVDLYPTTYLQYIR